MRFGGWGRFGRYEAVGLGRFEGSSFRSIRLGLTFLIIFESIIVSDGLKNRPWKGKEEGKGLEIVVGVEVSTEGLRITRFQS